MHLLRIIEIKQDQGQILQVPCLPLIKKIRLFTKSNPGHFNLIIDFNSIKKNIYILNEIYKIHA